MRLSDLKTGETGVVVKILGHGSFRKRVMEMGFVKGRPVTTVLYAPLLDPIKYSIMGYEVSLRRSEAHLIEIVKVDESDIPVLKNSGTTAETTTFLKNFTDKARKTINVALVGNPNCGKTSLFNIASGSHEHVGNYSGVTVDMKSGKFEFKGYKFNIVDLPGTYSLASHSPEELYVRNYLREETPDVIVNVVDASNLERNLYLTTELIDMDRTMVIALNMYDELKREGSSLDYELLGKMIGVPIVPTVSKTGKGVHELFDTIIGVFEGSHRSVRHVHVSLGQEMETAISSLRVLLKKNKDLHNRFSDRYVAIKLLEGDSETERLVRQTESGEEIISLRDRLVTSISKRMDEDVSSIIASEKYGFIAGALAETMVRSEEEKNMRTSFIDSIVTSKLFGFPLFFLIMFITFWLTFSLGQYPMDWMESGIDWLSEAINDNFSDGVLKDLIADGIVGGVGGVIVFLPNILILFCCLSLMEDSGYMARAAFIMDKVMHRIGLHGKSFIPLVMGFGCNVPAITATRTIESRSSRIITILINPFMSCSARLPLYVLLIGTFFPAHASLVFMGLYLLGIIVAVITARLLRRLYFKKDETPFVMELPPYRVPTVKAILRHTWSKGEQYLKKMGGIILVASVIVWALNYYPHHDKSTVVQPIEQSNRIDIHHDSFLEMAGKAIEPVMSPIGLPWRASVAALAGVPAKEIVVSTLGVLYTNNEVAPESSLSARLTSVNPSIGKPDFTPATALSFMVFILLYCPCIATITAIVRETRNWRYGAFSVLYNTVVAWLAAFGVYRLALWAF